MPRVCVFYVFLNVSRVNKESSNIQASLLMNVIHPAGQPMAHYIKPFVFIKEEKYDDIELLLKKFDNHFRTGVSFLPEISSREKLSTNILLR